MTVVAVLFANETPLIVSDSMISNRDPAAIGVHSPFTPEADQREGEAGYKPVGLARKYWILPDKTFFFYAGDVGLARNAYERLRTRIAGGETLSREMAEEERNAQCTPTRKFSCILIGPADEHGRCDYEPIGDVLEQDIEGYGYVLAIGGGSIPLLKLLHSSPKLAEDAQGPTRVLAALNAAALATLEYQEPDSELSLASSGAYFEVTIPSHFEHSWAHLIRGSAHVFMEMREHGPVITRLAVSKQNEAETIAVYSHETRAFVDSDFARIPAALLQTIRVAEAREKSTVGPYTGPLPITHLSSMSIYGSVEFPCEHKAYAKTVIFGPGCFVGALMELDDDEPILDGQPADLQMLFAPHPLKSLCNRLKAAKCSRCTQ